VAPPGHAGAVRRCPLIGVNRKWLAGGQYDAIDPNQTFFHILPHGHERAMAQLPANIFCICRLALLRCS
jgi:hypothetical protein